MRDLQEGDKVPDFIRFGKKGIFFGKQIEAGTGVRGSVSASIRFYVF
jgi:hypothetical protein